MTNDTKVLNILGRLAAHGTAPEEGCSLFGVGHEDAIERLRQSYLKSAFESGMSAEKFVVGPFGSGKTHFLRQLMEIARDMGCATAEVTLNKDIDFSKTILVYREVTAAIRLPKDSGRGIRALLHGAVERVRNCSDDQALAEELVRGWVQGLTDADFEDTTFARILRQALEALLMEERARFESCCRWLEGEVSNRTLAREVGATPVTKSEQNRFARKALQSLCQFIRHAKFHGTVICFDEAEQGLNIPKKLFDRVLSMLQSSINATSDLQKGSVLLVYAMTPDLVEEMMRFEALRQRITDPGPNMGFFDGNPRAAKIELAEGRRDPLQELESIGTQLVELLYGIDGRPAMAAKELLLARVRQMAREICDSDPTVSSRRTMAKRTATILLHFRETGSLEFSSNEVSQEEPEV